MIDVLDISRSSRWYRYRWSDQPPLPPDEIAASSVNMHMIPGNDSAAQALAGVRRGERLRSRLRLRHHPLLERVQSTLRAARISTGQSRVHGIPHAHQVTVACGCIEVRDSDPHPTEMIG